MAADRRRSSALGVSVWGLAQLEVGCRVLDALGFVAHALRRHGPIYCFWLILTPGAFWFVRMEMLQDLFTGLYRAGQYPVTVYPIGLKLVLTAPPSSLPRPSSATSAPS